MYLALEESVGFEPTEHFCSTVFKTVALNQTLPTFRVTGEKTGYLRSLSNGNQFVPTTVVATHRGFTLWRMLGLNQRLLFSRL